MTWDALKKYDFLVDSKEMVIRFAMTISSRLDLGQPIDGYLDMFYLTCNITFVLEDGSYDTDEEYDYLYALYTRVLVQHNRYLKGFVSGL